MRIADCMTTQKKPDKHIMVVEDDEAIRQLLKYHFEDAGYQAVGAENGKKALSLINGVSFELITLDLAMPEMNGNEFLAKLSQLSPSTPVIIVSANTRKLVPHPQVKGIIKKPFDLDDILELVNKYIL